MEGRFISCGRSMHGWGREGGRERGRGGGEVGRGRREVIAAGDGDGGL